MNITKILILAASISIASGYATADTVRPYVHKKFEQARDATERSDYAEAVEILEKMSYPRLTDHEQVVFHNIKAYVYYTSDQPKKAIGQYDSIINNKSAVKEMVATAIYSKAKLLLAIEDYAGSIEAFKNWKLKAGQANRAEADYYIAMAYVQMGDTGSALAHVNSFIGGSNIAALDEQWLLVARYVYLDQQVLDKAKSVLSVLTLKYSKPEYWRQLSAVYSQLGDKKGEAAVSEIAIDNGYMTKQGDYKRLAYLFYALDTPNKAVMLLEKGIAAGHVKKTDDILTLLVDANMAAKNTAKSIVHLENLTKRADIPANVLRLARVYYEQRDWEKAAEVITKYTKSNHDIAKEDRLLAATIYLNNNRFSEATRQVRDMIIENPDSATLGKQWLQFIDEEKQRYRYLSEYN